MARCTVSAGILISDFLCWIGTTHKTTHVQSCRKTSRYTFNAFPGHSCIEEVSGYLPVKFECQLCIRSQDIRVPPKIFNSLGMIAQSSSPNYYSLSRDYSRNIGTRIGSSSIASTVVRFVHAFSGILDENQADVNFVDHKGWTSLHLVSGCAHVDVVQLLLNHRMDVNVQNTNLWAPLHFGSTNGHLRVATRARRRSRQAD